MIIKQRGRRRWDQAANCKSLRNKRIFAFSFHNGKPNALHIMKRIYLHPLRWFDRIFTCIINVSILRFAFFITSHRLKLEAKIFPRDEREVSRDDR